MRCPKRPVTIHLKKYLLFFERAIAFKILGRKFAPSLQTSTHYADVAKLVDALDLGSSAARHGGSSPSIRTQKQ